MQSRMINTPFTLINTPFTVAGNGERGMSQEDGWEVTPHLPTYSSELPAVGLSTYLPVQTSVWETTDPLSGKCAEPSCEAEARAEDGGITRE